MQRRMLAARSGRPRRHKLPWPWALPFAGLLISIATGPLLFPKLWHAHYGKIAFTWSALTIVPIAALYDLPTALATLVHALVGEYMSFIILLFALYVVAGGILVTGTLRGTPLVNTAILAFGTAIASIVGTTGAAMILVRPLLRANAGRLHNVHVVVFFIILVANIGGALSPLGDPPLFVGFLHGVDFFWTTTHLWAPTATAAGLVLAAFIVVDVWFHRKDRRVAVVGEAEPEIAIGVRGLVNLPLIALIIGAILLSAIWKPGIAFDVYGTPLELQNLVRDVVLLVIAIVSLVATPDEHRERNGFSWEPILEVAKLFAGIFVCIVPVMVALQAGHDGPFAWLLALMTAEDGMPHERRLFLAHRRIVGAARQCADLSRVLRARRRRCGQADGRTRRDARRHLHGRGLHGRAHLYRQCAQFHDLRHRHRARRQDAELLRLHPVVRRDPAAGVRGAHLRFRDALALAVADLGLGFRLRRRLAAARDALCLGALGSRLGRHHRDRLDLDQRTGPGQPGDRDGRACGRGGGVDETIAHLAELPEMGDVGEVVVELDDVLEAGADRCERVLEVDEGLLRLGAEIAGRADDLVVEVEAELAGNVNDPPRPRRLDHMGVSGGLGDRVRVEEFVLRHGGVLG